MKQIDYNFVELETDESLELLAKSFGGILQSNTVRFDNPVVKGELVNEVPEDGLWIRKWKLTTFQKIVLHRNPAPKDDERKFSLIYFLNPSIFDLKKSSKKVVINNKCNNLFLSNQVMMDFSVLPRQPFYVVDITFTASWLIAQFNDAHDGFKKVLDQCLHIDPKTILMKPCQPNEYQILHEMDERIDEQPDDKLFIRSRTYQLICSFFTKVFNKESDSKHAASHYEQIVQAEKLIMRNLRIPPKLGTIAKMINMSISVLVRNFKSMYGKSVQEYYLEKKMELAKKMIIENGVSINRVAQELGYKQASPFIQTFTKRYGYSPGSLKR